MPHIEDVITFCLAQDGDRYVLGHEVRATDADPDTFDCSELVEWACARAGVDPKMPDGSWIQASHCDHHRTMISIEAGIATRGALLFRTPVVGDRYTPGHVAVSLGDGRTIEARGRKWGVGVFPARGRTWTHAALIPGVSYAAHRPPTTGEPTMPGMNLTDTDREWIEGKLFATAVGIAKHLDDTIHSAELAVLAELNPNRDPDNTLRSVCEATYNEAHAAANAAPPATPAAHGWRRPGAAPEGG